MVPNGFEMKKHNHPESSGDTADNLAPKEKPTAKKRPHWLRGIAFVLLVVIALITAARLLLPSELRKYVNRTLDRNQLYEGRIGDVQVHLLRGSYSICDAGTGIELCRELRPKRSADRGRCSLAPGDTGFVSVQNQQCNHPARLSSFSCLQI